MFVLGLYGVESAGRALTMDGMNISSMSVGRQLHLRNVIRGVLTGLSAGILATQSVVMSISAAAFGSNPNAPAQETFNIHKQRW